MSYGFKLLCNYRNLSRFDDRMQRLRHGAKLWTVHYFLLSIILTTPKPNLKVKA